MYPALMTFLTKLDKSSPDTKMHFLLDPESLPDIRHVWELHGLGVIQHIHYLTRTYAYYLYRQKQILVGNWPSDNCANSRKICQAKGSGTGSTDIDNINNDISGLNGSKRSTDIVSVTGTRDGNEFPYSDCADKTPSYHGHVPDSIGEQPPNHPVLVPLSTITVARPVNNLSGTKQCHATDHFVGPCLSCPGSTCAESTIETRLTPNVVIGGIPHHVDCEYDRNQHVCGVSCAGVCGFAGGQVWDVTRQFSEPHNQ